MIRYHRSDDEKWAAYLAELTADELLSVYISAKARAYDHARQRGENNIYAMASDYISLEVIRALVVRLERSGRAEQADAWPS